MLQLALILSVLLSCVAAWIIAHRYRRRMQQLMRAPRARDPTSPATVAAEGSPPPAPVSLADNRAAGLRLTMLLIALSCLLAVTSACIWYALSLPEEPLAPERVAVMSLLHLWPVIPALALVWRWSRSRLFGTLLLWCGVCFAIFLWRSVEPRPLQILAGIASDIGLPLVLVSLVFLGNATRAIAPWLLMQAALLTWASLASLNWLMDLAERRSPVLMSLLVLPERLLGWYGLLAVAVSAALLPWALAWWPARMLGRALGRAYSRKWLSDLLVVFVGVWAFSLTDRALTVALTAGAGAAAMYLPLLWIPAVLWLARRWRRPRTRPATLLVLRVFRQDAQARFLFDHVVERWRLSGNTVMLAGTDLADRTLGADDIFQFLDGRLAERFIVSPADVARRIAAFDMAPDIDGRHRVNECYCHDTTWQDALRALVGFSDVVLMDLRGFQAHNAGCRFELTTLAQVTRELRVVVLSDSRTDRAAAQEALAFGRQERFTWSEASHFKPSKRREVLARLFA
jgi:hypothetical protein